MESSAPRRHGIGLVAEGQNGSWRYRDAVDILHIYISNAKLADVSAREGQPFPGALREDLNLNDPVLSALSMEVAQAIERKEAGSLYVETLGLAMSMRLLRAHAQSVPPKPNASAAAKLSPWQLKVSTNFVRDNLAREILLTDLAAAVRLSPFHFARAFKNSTGVPPHRYQTLQRMELARKLLETTGLSIAEIGAQVGYEDPSYFARSFAKEVGMAPSRFRQEWRS